MEVSPVQRMAAWFGLLMVVLLMLVLFRAYKRPKPSPLVFPAPPTQEQVQKPELLPEPREDPVDLKPIDIPKDPVVPFIATPELVVVHMLTMANVQRGDVLYDLGSGDGRIVIMAAKQYGARAFGYELNANLVKQSRDSIVKQKLEKLATIEQRDIYRLDLSRGTVITLYLSVEANLRLVPELEKMKPGSRIVSHMYPIEGYKPVSMQTVKINDGVTTHLHPIYLYTIPLEKE